MTYEELLPIIIDSSNVDTDGIKRGVGFALYLYNQRNTRVSRNRLDREWSVYYYNNTTLEYDNLRRS